MSQAWWIGRHSIIPHEKRLALIQMVDTQHIDISKASKKLSIKVPTAKSIVYHFRKTGEIKKVRQCLQLKKLQIRKAKKRLTDQKKRNQIKIKEQIEQVQKIVEPSEQPKPPTYYYMYFPPGTIQQRLKKISQSNKLPPLA